jgi:hypothetical protein
MAEDVLRVVGVHICRMVIPSVAWLRRKRAAGWPVVDGRIESVKVSNRRLSFIVNRSYYFAELGYSYSVAGTLNSSRYRRDFPTEQEAEEFVRDLQGKAVVVHYNPGKPSNSALLEPAIEALLQNRAPAPAADFPSAAKSVPDWIRPFPWFFVCFSAAGLLVSLWVHIGAVMGRHGSVSILGSPRWYLRRGSGGAGSPTIGR